MSVYAVRISTEATQNIVEIAFRYLEDTGDADGARQVAQALHDQVGALAQSPRRFAVVQDESRQLGQETRRMLLAPAGEFLRVHVFYRVEEESQDGPQVWVVCLRNARRGPISRKEAWRIRGNQ